MDSFAPEASPPPPPMAFDSEDDDNGDDDDASDDDVMEMLAISMRYLLNTLTLCHL